MIKEQMRRVSENRSKNHDQITDEIYRREYERYDQLYQDYSAYKKSYENKHKITGYALQLKKERAKFFEQKLERDRQIKEDFKKLSYFQYITIANEEMLSFDKRKLHSEMLAGRFDVNIANEMPFQDKVQAYANESLTYYLY